MRRRRYPTSVRSTSRPTVQSNLPWRSEISRNDIRGLHLRSRWLAFGYDHTVASRVKTPSPKVRKTAGRPRELVLRIAHDQDKHRFTPETADPVQILALAASYLESLQVIAADAGETLRVEGIELRPGSVELAFRVDKLAPVQAYARELARAMAATDPPAPIKRLKAAIARLPVNVHAEVQVGAWKSSVESATVSDQQPLRELTTLRAKLLRIGGIRRAVRLRTSDDRDFSLEASEDQLRALGAQLYREVEIEAEVERDQHGNVEDGRLLSFAVVMEDQDPAGAWQTWFDENAGEWDEASVEELLGGDRN
jgi:hypothetical protein